MSIFQGFWIRGLALLLLLMMTPVLIALTAAIVMFRRRPFFRQARVGQYGKQFMILKFRTMDDSWASPSITTNDASFARFAYFLRRTRLDELPQLYNIVCGQMTFVGPRPLRAADLVGIEYGYDERHSVKPGLTGLAQVNGGNTITFSKKLDYDLKYIRNRNFVYNMRIILLTVIRLIEGVDTVPDVTLGRRNALIRE